MNTANLHGTIALLRVLLSELDDGLPNERWKMLRRVVRSMVRLQRGAEVHRKYRATFQDADNRDPQPTALQVKLFNEMVDLHLAIHRRLKKLRELE